MVCHKLKLHHFIEDYSINKPMVQIPSPTRIINLNQFDLVFNTHLSGGILICDKLQGQFSLDLMFNIVSQHGGLTQWSLKVSRLSQGANNFFLWKGTVGKKLHTKSYRVMGKSLAHFFSNYIVTEQAEQNMRTVQVETQSTGSFI